MLNERLNAALPTNFCLKGLMQMHRPRMHIASVRITVITFVTTFSCCSNGRMPFEILRFVMLNLSDLKENLALISKPIVASVYINHTFPFS